MPRFGLSLLVCMTIMLGWAQMAAAIPFFGKVFVKEYIQDHKDKEYAEFVKKKAKCFVCHQGKKKKHHNEFGEHLEDLLDKKKHKKDKAKVNEALKKVLAMHSDPKNKKSPTYLELIQKSKLPGGKLEDLKKEPKKKTKDSKEKDSKDSKKEEAESKQDETTSKKDEAESKENESKEEKSESKEEKSSES